MNLIDFALNHVCYVDRAISTNGLFFDVFVILGTLGLLYILSRTLPRWWYHYFAVMSGVVIFEMFTSPMWNNPSFGKFAYVYQDVSWVLTIGWSSLILGVVVLVDYLFARTSEARRFWLYILGMGILGFIAEVFVVNLGLRTYSEEVLAVLTGPHLLNVPIEALYYIPVFTALVIGFYKYWATVLHNAAVLPEKHVFWWRSLYLSVIAVILFELMVEPMAVNTGLPTWSYIYNDISILMTGGWILIIWLSTKLVDKFFVHLDLKKRFGLYILIGGYIAVVVESLYVSSGLRSYGPSAVRDFVGLHTPLTNLPIEIFFAMPMYMALMVAFMRYWEVILSKGFIQKK